MSALSVTVSGPRAEAEVVLPDDVALGDLLPALSLSYAGAGAADTVVLVPGHGPLGPATTLRDAGVRPGAVINVFPQHVVGPLPGTGQEARPAPAREVRAPRPPRTAARRAACLGQPATGWAWKGAHGGAGASSLARAIGGTDLGGAEPGTTGVPVVVVTRTHAPGLLAAQELAVALSTEGSPGWACLGLVTVADAPGRLPRPLGDLCRLVTGGYGRTWHVGWIEAWRFGEATAEVPRSVRRLAKALTRTTMNREVHTA